MAKVTFTTAYNRKKDFIRDCNAKTFTAPSKVKASLIYATDINEIYQNYCNTGKLPLNGKQPIYDENFVNYDSLIEAQKLVSDASEYFVGLPGDIKAQYGNSLERFVKALSSGDQYLIDKGVLVKPTNDVIKEGQEVVQPVVETTVTETVNTATTD